jgi:N6-adenosine-specific RNA methylase IME4
MMSIAQPYRTLVADPPWFFKDQLPGKSRGASKNYPCMRTADICAFPIPPLADDCWFFLWRPATHQRDALEVAEAWGFTGAPSELIWRKVTNDGDRLRIGMGRAFRNAHETCLVFKRGRPVRLSKSLPSMFDAPRGEHSAKPDRFYRHVQAFAPGPTVELFARRQWPGWTCLGNEMPAVAVEPPRTVAKTLLTVPIQR